MVEKLKIILFCFTLFFVEGIGADNHHAASSFLERVMINRYGKFSSFPSAAQVVIRNKGEQ